MDSDALYDTSNQAMAARFGLRTAGLIRAGKDAADMARLAASFAFRADPSLRLREDDALPRVPVVSSNIRSLGYADGVLDVEFLSGAVYRYREVPVLLYQRLQEAPSIGQFFHHQIRSRFAFEKVLPRDRQPGAAVSPATPVDAHDPR